MSEALPPKVSVCIITYNQAPFICQALDSVLAQQTSFPIEILVGEDDSTDGTREIVRRYAERRPDIIRPFFNDRSNVVRVEGLAIAARNLADTLRQARGEYIALLEGDDYWIHPAKLQRQVDLLDARPDCSFCFHRAWVLDEATGERQSFHDAFVDVGTTTEFAIEDFFFRWIVPTASIVYRRSMLTAVPGWFFRSLSGDHALQLLLASKGHSLMLDDFMSVYRRHSGGFSRSLLPDVHGPNWTWMHHAFNAMNAHKYDCFLAHRLAGDFSTSSRFDPHVALRPVRALRDLFLSLSYGRRSGVLSTPQCVARVAAWCSRLVFVGLVKGARRLKASTS